MPPPSPLVRLTSLAALALFLAAHGGCGGGGGGAPAAAQVIDLGLVSATSPTTLTHVFTNPLGVGATVSEPLPGAPFRIAPGALPQNVPAGAQVGLPVVLTPAGPGPVAGTVTVGFAGGGAQGSDTASFRADVEALSFSFAPTVLDFGTVQGGASRDLVVRLTNASLRSTVTLTTFEAPHADVSLVTALPISVAPGAQVDVTVRVSSAVGDPIDGLLRLGANDPGGPVQVSILANATLREVVTDLGSVSFVTNDTAPLQVQVPADAISLTVEARGLTTHVYGLGELTGPGGKVYENTSSTGEYIWNAGQEIFTAQVPNTDRTGLQLVPGGGTYTFRIRRLSGTAPTVAVRVIVERRSGGTSTQGVLPLNVWLAQGLAVDAAGAATDARLQEVLAGLGTILSGQGVTLGDIDYYDVTDPAFDAVTSAEFPQLLALTAAAPDARLNLFFVQQTLSGGVIGVAGTIGGPRVNGTQVSGVMSVYDGFSTGLISLVAAHEIGHFLGLYHTVEQSGTHDFIDDTLECPANATSAACPVVGGGYLMHWQAVGGSSLTAGQGLVLRGHPLVEAAPGGTPKPRGTLVLDPVTHLELESLGAGWCGTCQPAGHPGAGKQAR